MATEEIPIGRWMKGLIPPTDWVMSQVQTYGNNITIREEDGWNIWYAVSSRQTYSPPR